MKFSGMLFVGVLVFCLNSNVLCSPSKRSEFETNDDLMRSMHDAVNPSPTVIAPEDPRFPVFMQYAKHLNATINFNFNPCSNFYEYVCSPDEYPGKAFEQNSMIFTLLGLRKPGKFEAMQKLKQYFDDCVAGPPPQEVIRKTYESARKTLGLDFPALSGAAAEIAKPSKAQLSKIANFGDIIRIQTVEFPRKNNFLNTVGVVSAPLLEMGRGYSYRNEWNEDMRPFLKTQLLQLLKNLSKYLSLPVNEAIIEQDIDDVLLFEKYLADYGGFDIMLQKQTAPQDLHLTLTIGDANQRFSFLNVQSAIHGYLQDQPDEVKARFSSEEAEIVIILPDRLANLSSYVLSNAVTGRTLYNYIFLKKFYPLREVLQPNPIPTKDKVFRDSIKVNITAAEGNCLVRLLSEEGAILRLLLDRLYMDERLPNKEYRKTKFLYITQMVKDIIEGFRLEINKMKWPETFKNHVATKLNNMQINVGYPTKVDSDRFLNDFYSEWNLTDSNPMQSLDLFQNVQNVKTLMSLERDRTDFGQRVSQFNAFNQPTRNSINILDGVLYPFLYDVQYPAAANYGAIGGTIAHEIVHSFDISGVEYDELGYLNSWLDPESKRLFDSMAECVINQYNAMTTAQGWPINGRFTAGENIADNGGIHGAFNAYKTHQTQVGEDPRLPIDRVSAISNDQLFFIGYAKFFCGPQVTSKAGLYSDEHAPQKNRVIGVLQNFNEFKKAFNCKPTDLYAQKHCDVYTVSDHDC